MDESMSEVQDWRGFTATPEDVLFFRDSRPSTIGADHYLQSIFPPLPSTLYGMLRTCRLMDTGGDLENLGEKRWSSLAPEIRREVGEWGSLGTLRLRGPWLVREEAGGRQEMLFPAPADLGLVTGESGAIDRVVRYLPTTAANGQGWSHTLALLEPKIKSEGRWTPLPGGEPAVPATDWLVTREGLTQWLAGTTPDPGSFARSTDLWLTEQRTGVGIQSDRRTAKDGMLYTFGFVRLLRGVSLGFEISGSTITSGVTATLGGEGRLVRLDHGPSLSESIRAGRRDNEMSALYLATPGVFAGDVASRPASLSIRAAAVRSMTHAGGWDLAKKQPKPLRRAVPAGSVYYTDTADVASFMKISEGHEEGFGVVLAGAY
ncbi:MAG: type III-B CRISPR module-associated protein Cmr3 [Acidobacteriota bacterium]